MTSFAPSELPSPKSDQEKSRHGGCSPGGSSRLPGPGLFEALREGSLSRPLWQMGFLESMERLMQESGRLALISGAGLLGQLALPATAERATLALL